MSYPCRLTGPGVGFKLLLTKIMSCDVFAQTKMHRKRKLMDHFSHSERRGAWRAGVESTGGILRRGGGYANDPLAGAGVWSPCHPFFSSVVEAQEEAFKIIPKYTIHTDEWI